MNIGELYSIAVQEAIKQDPRGKNGVLKYLASLKAQYKRLSGYEKRLFDKNRLSNPYSDSRILFGSPSRKVKTIMAGVDVETQELLLLDRLNSKGGKIDLAISHHPQGMARADFYQVMTIINDVLKSAGVKGPKIEKMLNERMQEVSRKILPGNCTRAVDAARLLDIPYMCLHTVCDNFVYKYFDDFIKKEKPARVSDILDALYQAPEYKLAAQNNLGPRIISGKISNKCGKVLIEMTGGTEGPKNIYSELTKKKINTLICMHLSEEHFKKAKKHKFNIIIAGHISSDILGMNLMFDTIEKYRKLNFIECSGFKRIRRK